MTTRNLQRRVDEWNARHPIGTSVRYWPLVSEPDNYTDTVTRSVAEVLSGHTAVVWLAGKAGCVALDHCAALPLGELAAALVHFPRRT